MQQSPAAAAAAPQPSTDTTNLPEAPSSTAIEFPTVGSADVAIFWDFENVRIPLWCPATTASEAIRNKVTKYGRIVEKRLYFDSRQATELSAPRSDLDLSGFTLVDCPSRGRKETLDKKLIVDVLCFAWERASMGAKACVVLITSDGDYSYALARLRDIGVFTFVIYRPDIVAKVLIDNANVVMSWEFDVLGGPPESQAEDEYDDEVQEQEDEVEPDGDGSKSSSVKTTTPAPETVEVIGKDAEEEVVLKTPVVKKPNLQTREKFALFCSVVLNAQHRNVREGISIYSSWADEGNCAANFYGKVGEKDREGYFNIRQLATEKGFIEWGRRKLAVPGKPVIKVKNRNERAEGLSSESYMRLTYSGLSIVNPGTNAKDSEWTSVVPKPTAATLLPVNSIDGSVNTVSTSGQQSISTNQTHKKVLSGKIFVGGLAWETTEDSLRSYFLKYGPIDKVVVKEGRGFGFVSFRSPKDAELVLNKQGKHFVDLTAIE